MIRIGQALAVTLIAFASFAQSAAEFGRASGGEISVITKQPRRLSGSLGLTLGNGGQGYGATLGGSVLDDRMWFFASAAQLPSIQQFASPGGSSFQAVDAKVTAQPVDWSSISASFSRHDQQPIGTSLQMPNAPLPSSFLSLRSTTMVSDSVMFNFSFSRTTAKP
ncbi:MAG TPA: hypothetical protein VF111_02610 [Thermoanaerobaculia bacterium]